MELPKFNETFIPILEILNEIENIHSRDLYNRVRDKYYSSLPNELLELKTSSGATVLLNRIGWGKSYLKQGNFVFYPKKRRSSNNTKRKRNS